ncbi:MAG: hypothetical protein II171_05275 [Bacteroidales bacterium]|nr:hypothetical protein [Bacteroidales bacterium]
MKAKEVLIFICGVMALLGLLWVVTPADGLAAGPVTLRFASLQRSLQDAGEVPVDVDSVLSGVESRFQMKRDTLDYYREFFYENPDRIYLPGNDYRFFDPLFRQMEQAGKRKDPIRVVHYGDSQIEMDRISQDFRQALQDRFGGSGTGLFPAVGNVPSASISKSASGGFVQYTMYGDSTTMRAGHNRYGIMAQVVKLSGGGTVSLRASKNKTAREGVKTFTSVSLLYGRPSAKFTARAVSDTLKPQPVVETAENAIRLTWHFGKPVQKATLYLQGDAEIYGISTDGDGGVAVDNIPLRGCSGTIFTRISEPLMQESMQLEDVRLILLQFGGNYVPVLYSQKSIGQYQDKILAQIRYFKRVAPQAKILFIGPSDMGTSRGGRMVTRPFLPELVDSLKATCLRNDVAYWDLYRMMGGENSMAQWVKHKPALAGPDYTHFTPAGAQKVGDAFSRSFLTCYDFYRLRKTLPARRVQEAMTK